MVPRNYYGYLSGSHDIKMFISSPDKLPSVRIFFHNTTVYMTIWVTFFQLHQTALMKFWPRIINISMNLCIEDMTSCVFFSFWNEMGLLVSLFFDIENFMSGNWGGYGIFGRMKLFICVIMWTFKQTTLRWLGNKFST